MLLHPQRLFLNKFYGNDTCVRCKKFKKEKYEDLSARHGLFKIHGLIFLLFKKKGQPKYLKDFEREPMFAIKMLMYSK